jgi:hypothetical protein
MVGRMSDLMGNDRTNMMLWVVAMKTPDLLVILE